MIVGVHNFVDALGRFKDDTVNNEGGLWIIAMDGLLLIPLAMAAFFYPIIALGSILAVGIVSVISMLMVRAHHKGQLHLPHWLTRGD